MPGRKRCDINGALQYVLALSEQTFPKVVMVLITRLIWTFFFFFLRLMLLFVFSIVTSMLFVSPLMEPCSVC